MYPVAKTTEELYKDYTTEQLKVLKAQVDRAKKYDPVGSDQIHAELKRREAVQS